MFKSGFLFATEYDDTKKQIESIPVIKQSFEKQLKNEKLLKQQAVNKLAEVMNRKDSRDNKSKHKVRPHHHLLVLTCCTACFWRFAFPTKVSADLLKKKEKECRRLQADLEKEKEKYSKLCISHKEEIENMSMVRIKHY